MKFIIVTLLLILNPLLGQKLKIYYGNWLCFQDREDFYKIKTLENDGTFQGYDIIDSLHIFFAYENAENAEASTTISIFDISTGKETIIEEIGDTGESFFQYNRENDLVLFNWFDGLYIFKLHDKQNHLILKPEKKRINLCNACYLPFWVDSKKVGYNVFENEKWTINYLILFK